MIGEENIVDIEDVDIIPFCNLLSIEEQQILKANSNVVRHANHNVICMQGTRTSHIMVLKSGLSKVYKEGRNNKTIILKLCVAPSFIGLMSLFGSDIHQYSVAAIGTVDILYIDINAFKKIIQQNGNFAYRLVQDLSREGLFIFDRLMSQSHKQLPGRIADVLLYFSEQIYHSTSFEFPVTRRELAELAGTTKESFIRTLTEFKNDKIIQLDGSKVEIVSMKIIKTLSELG